MEDENQNSGWGIGAGIGFSALIALLVSVIIGILRLSKPKENANLAASTTRVPDPVIATESQTELAARKPGMVPPPIQGGLSQPVSTRWSIGTKYFVSAMLLLALIGILYISSSSFSTIILAALLTFIVHPIIQFFQKRFKLRRGGAIALTYLLVVSLIILIPILIIPGIVEAIQFLASYDYTELLQSFSNWLVQQAQMIAAMPIFGASFSGSLEELAIIVNNLGSQTNQTSTRVDVSIQELGGRITQSVQYLVAILGPLVSIAISVVFTLLISLHMNLSANMLQEGFLKLIPSNYRGEIEALMRRIVVIWQSFLRGQLSLMVIVGVFVWIGNEIIGTPQALFLGLLAGFLEVIPSLGPLLATIPAVILALLFGSQTSFLHLDQLENWAFALVVIGLYILVQIIENQLLVPYVLGDAVDLPPLIVIIGVVVFGSAFGLLGIFLATPVISTGREVFVYLYDKILEPPPEPEPPEARPSLMKMLRNYAARIPRPNFRRKKPAELTAENVTEQITGD